MTYHVDILNPKAVKLLQDLADLDLISIKEVPAKDESKKNTSNGPIKYKGVMTKQPLADTDNQLKNLRG